MDTQIKLEKDFAYHEVYTDSNNVIKDIARLLALGIESEEIIDESGIVIKPTSPIVDKCWKVVYPTPVKTLFPDVQDWDNLLPDEYKAITNHQIESAKDTIILKTTTIPKTIEKNNSTSIGVNHDLNVDSIDMYLELYMPEYLCDSEIDDATRQREGYIPTVIDVNAVAGTKPTKPNDIVPNKVARNYHHIYMRIFDNIKEDFSGPAENIYDPSTRDVVQWNSRSSEWTKLSWYQDFEEKFLADIIGDREKGAALGSVRVPITRGLTSETKIKIWINVNRNRFILGVMGSQNVDFSNNRWLIGLAYVGQIESFDFSINDTAGNFGLFATSSSSPAMAKTDIMTRATVPYTQGANIDGRFPVSTIPLEVNSVSALEFETIAQDIPPIPYDYSKPNGGDEWGDRYISKGTVKVFFKSASANQIIIDGVTSSLLVSDNVQIPCDVIIDSKDRRKVKIVVSMRDVITKTCGSRAEAILKSKKFSFAKDGEKVATNLEYSFSYYTEYVSLTGGVSRDKFGNSIKYEFPTTYGKNTANGITDISMYATFTKDYFQKHSLIFASTEEYAMKELYGKSAYTGEYFADKLKVYHSSEGLRGILSGLMTMDTSGVYFFDELVVNKNFKKYTDKPEELYTFLPITAPFCPFSNSPNGRHGVGILKDIRYPVPVTDDEIVNFALKELERKYEGTDNVIADFPLISDSEYGAKITWESSDASAIRVEELSAIKEQEEEEAKLKKK